MYKRSLKLSVFSLALCLMFMMTFLGSTAFAETTAAQEQKSQIERISGADRYKTAVEISKSGWDKSKYAVIARGDNFADALSAGPLAQKFGAPILLTESSNLSSDVLNELKRLEVENVYIVGGTGAVSTVIENTLKATKVNDKAITVKRLAGTDRVGTSIKVAEEIGTSHAVVIATGDDYPDALSIAPIASSKGMPIILAENGVLTDSAKAYLEGNKDNIETTYIIGGHGVIHPSVDDNVTNPVRLSGDDRFGTNLEVLAYFSDEIDFENIYLAVGDGVYGDEFADALAGAALAAKTSSPVVLMYQTIPANTYGLLALASSNNARVIALGGNAVVPQDAAESLVNVLKVPVILGNLGLDAQRGTETDFQVATLAKGAKDEVVRVRVKIKGDTDIVSIKYKEVKDGKYYDLPFDENRTAWYGPETGFPLSDITSDFKVSFSETGSVDYLFEVVRLSDNKVLTYFPGNVEVSELKATGDAARAYAVPTNFNTHLGQDYIGYNVGWKLTDALALDDISKMEVSLLDENGTILVTNVSTDKISSLDTKEFSTPFNVNRAIEYKDEYWTFGGWMNDSEQPAKAEITLTNKNGDTYTVVNDSLTVVAGHEDVAKYLETYDPEVLSGEEAEEFVTAANFNTHFNVSNALDYVGYNVGWKLTDALALDKVAKMEISLLDEDGEVLVTNTSTEEIFNLDTKEFSTPFNVNKHIEYDDEYWTFGEWEKGFTEEPVKAQMKITTIYGDTYTIVNDSLAVVEGHSYVNDYLGE